MMCLVEYNLRNAELLRDVIMCCRRVGMEHEWYVEMMMDYTQHAIDRRNGKSRLVRNMWDLRHDR